MLAVFTVVQHHLGVERRGEQNGVALEREAFAGEAAPAHQSERQQEEEADPDQARQQQQRRDAAVPRGRRLPAMRLRWPARRARSSLRLRRPPTSPSAAAGRTRTAAGFQARNTCWPGCMPAPCARATLTFSIGFADRDIELERVAMVADLAHGAGQHVLPVRPLAARVNRHVLRADQEHRAVVGGQRVLAALRRG